jgi:hypothetical protein
VGRFTDAAVILRTNGVALAAAGAWFLAGLLVAAIGPYLDEVAVGFLFAPSEAIAFALTATGVLTVVLYAVAVGVTVVEHDGVDGPASGASTAPGDD